MAALMAPTIPGIETSVAVGSVTVTMHAALVLLPVGGLIVASVLLIVLRRTAKPAASAAQLPPGRARAMSSTAQEPSAPALQPAGAWLPQDLPPQTWRPAD
jgi:hypothetical protein